MPGSLSGGALPFTDYTAEDYALVTSVNLAGFFWLTQRAIGQMLKQHGGHVVNISASIADHADSVEPTALTALTKGGLAAVTKSLAIEYASRGIRVNAVAPGITQTPLQPPESYTPEALAGNCPRSGVWVRSETSWTASCTWSQRRTSPERSCTSTFLYAEQIDLASCYESGRRPLRSRARQAFGVERGCYATGALAGACHDAGAFAGGLGELVPAAQAAGDSRLLRCSK